MLRFVLLWCALGVSSCTLLLEPFGRAGDADLSPSHDTGEASPADADGTSPADADETSPADADETSPADADETSPADADEARSNVCPLNSGAYCTCDRQEGVPCDDGSTCVFVENLGPQEGVGFCSPPCQCDGSVTSCGSSPFASTPECVLHEWGIHPSDDICGCALVHCTGPEDCPEGQDCRSAVGTYPPYDGVLVSFCSP